MAIDWKDEAIKAAEEAYTGLKPRFVSSAMRAALDAAVKAQGLDAPNKDFQFAFKLGVTQGRAEALEEAAAEAIKEG